MSWASASLDWNTITISYGLNQGNQDDHVQSTRAHVQNRKNIAL